jgi:tRNA(fMet)-specific endonuclease VapC
MTFLLDSDTLTLAFHNHPLARPKVEAALACQEVGLPIFVRAEALRGRLDAVLKAATPADVLRMQDRLHETETFLSRFPVAVFDPVAGHQYQRLAGLKSLKRTGHADLLIACVALTNNATLVTRNAKDFAGIPNLKLENWAA